MNNRVLNAKLSTNGRETTFAKVIDEAMRGTDDIDIPTLPPEEESPEGKIYQGQRIRDIEVVSMADIDKELGDLKFLIPDWIPFGLLSCLFGPPGRGKSALALWLAKTVIEGEGYWFNHTKGPKEGGYVLWCSTEHDHGLTRRRMQDWGIPKDKLLFPFKDPYKSIDLYSDDDIKRLTDVICKAQTKLVVIDSLRGAHGFDENSSIVGRVLDKIASVAVQTRVAILIVAHAKKLAKGEGITGDSLRGTNAQEAKFRCVIGIERPDPKRDLIAMKVVKTNLPKLPEPVGYRITDKGLEFSGAPEKPQKAIGNVLKWLRARVPRDQWVDAKPILIEGASLNFSGATICRARKKLGIDDRKNNRKSEWHWATEGER